MSKNKSRQFCRVRKDPGVCLVSLNKEVGGVDQTIRIRNREVYNTSDPEIIKIFENDPEICEYNPNSSSNIVQEAIIEEKK